MCISEWRFTSAIPKWKWLLSAAENNATMTPYDVSEDKIQMLIKFY